MIEKIKKTLDKVYKKPYIPKRSPIEQAVFTILSQNTTDKQAERCLERLKSLVKNDFNELALLPEDKIKEAIKGCGLYEQKSKAIKEVTLKWKEIEEKLRKLGTAEGLKLLKSFPGIGSKTARVILLFGFHKNAFPIDTHCRRVLKRVGIFPENWKTDKISEFMEKHFSFEFNRKFHYDLIRIGREFCRPKNPRCSECPLKEVCQYAKGQLLYNIQSEERS